jgi:hypothetical protein
LSSPRADDVHVDEPWLSVRWDPNHHCVYAEFRKFANSTEFRAGTMRIIDAVRERHAAGLISDNRRLEGVVYEDQLWLRDTWVPLAVAAGIKRIAVVVAHQGLGKIATEEIIGRFRETEFMTRTFESVADAQKWVAR